MEDKPLIDSFVIVDCQNQLLNKKSEAHRNEQTWKTGIKYQIYVFGCTTKIEYVLVNSLKFLVKTNRIRLYNHGCLIELVTKPLYS